MTGVITRCTCRNKDYLLQSLRNFRLISKSGNAIFVKHWKVINHCGCMRIQPIKGMADCHDDRKVGPTVKVEPDGHLLIDEELRISVSGLMKSQEVTIHTFIEEDSKSIESLCCFKADDNGVVDLYNQPSLSGSYTGVSPMGIFWSLTPSPGMPKGFRLMKKNINPPMIAKLSVYDGHLTAAEIQTNTSAPVRSLMIERWYKGQGVTSIDVTDGRLRGRLFLPAGTGPFPGVIDLFGTVGGITEFRSALLASRGIASLALPYFAYKDLPKSLFDMDLDYFLEAVTWLRAHKKVFSEGVGVIGVSKGGDIGFMMAANCPQVRAFANINGCSFNSNFPMKFSGGDIPPVEMDLRKMERMEGAWSSNKTFTFTEKDLTPVRNFIENDRLNAKNKRFADSDEYYLQYKLTDLSRKIDVFRP